MAENPGGPYERGPDADASPAGGPGPRLSPDRQLASMTGKNTFAAIQIATTLSAAASGLVLYAILIGWHVNSLVALLLGLVFALLARRAVTTLLLEWLVARARQRAQQDGAPPGDDPTTPGMPGGPPRG